MSKTGYDLPVMKYKSFKNEVSKLPMPDDVIEEILPKNEVGLICGDPWQGKSLELQYLMSCFSSGTRKYHGLKVKKCGCLYITWEGSTKGIIKRLDSISRGVTLEIEPQIKLVSAPIPLNIPAGYSQFCKILDEAKKNGNVEVVLADSAPYTMSGNVGRNDVISDWWTKVQKVISDHDLTLIFSWEFVKQIIFDARLKEQTFDIGRLKTASTTAYKVNTVLAIGELKDLVKRKWVSLGTKLVLLKSKDSPHFQPLSVKLSRNMTFGGEHWEYNASNDIWIAVKD